jgi:hypothetical protein
VRPAALACVALLAAARAFAGTELTIETRKAGGAPEAAPQRSVVEVEGKRLRAEAGNGRHGALWNGDAGVLEILDHREKSVLRIDRATARSLAKNMDGAREQIRAGAERLPAAQRDAVERWLGGSSDAPVTLASTGKSAEVNGIRCRLLDAIQAGAKLAEICEGPRGAAGVPPETLATLRELAAFFAEVGDLLPRSLGAEGLEALTLAPRIEGVPLRVRAWPKHAVPTESRLVRALAKSYPPSRFEVPAGYQASIGVHVRE